MVCRAHDCLTFRHSTLLARLLSTVDPSKAQKRLLSSVEQLIGAGPNADVLLKRAAHVLKALYDADLVEEEAILKWYEKGSKKKVGTKVREAAAPFVQWLKEAEEASASD